MGFFLTYLLIIPYIAVLVFFFTYKKDNFFLKISSSVQLLIILILLGICFIEILIWKCFFQDYSFLGFNIKNTGTQFKTTAVITILAAIAAVFGWIFTSRVQIINTTRSHSVQVLMNSRNSTIYMDKVDKATIIRRKLTEKRNKPTDKDKGLFGLWIGKKNTDFVKIQSVEKIQLTEEEYKNLEHDEKSAVTYLLNFLEFVAIGIRHNNLDEDLIKGSFKSILKSNYILFEPIIEFLRKQDNPKIYLQLEMLHKRWDEENELKCYECKKWYKVGLNNDPNELKKIYVFHVFMSILSFGSWLILILIMKFSDSITKHKESKDFICIDCGVDNNTPE